MTSTSKLPSIFFAEGWQTEGNQRATLEINWRNRTIEVRQQFDGDCRHIPYYVFFGHSTRWYIEGDVTMHQILDLLETHAEDIDYLMANYRREYPTNQYAAFWGTGDNRLYHLKQTLNDALCVPGR